MNIFYLDENPVAAAKCLVDKHVVRMVLETAQILSTVSARYGVEAPYRATHKNHPAVLWAGNTKANWEWTVLHGTAIACEYMARFGKDHKSAAVIDWCLEQGGRPGNGCLETPVQCMPEQYRREDPVEAYRKYYIGDKIRMAAWREPGAPPVWFQEAVGDQMTSWRMTDKNGEEYGPIIRGVRLTDANK